MKKINLRIFDDAGMHIKPSTDIYNICKKYGCDLVFSHGNKKTKKLSPVEILSFFLDIKSDNVITIELSSKKHESIVLDKIISILEKNKIIEKVN